MDGIVTWIHADHLHSATILTDADGNEIRRLAYRAFGEELENTGAGTEAKYSYTGKERDANGLLYYGARYYDPALSRFITPDTIYDKGTQGLNRYSYALNNPVRYNDPSGHLSFSPDDDPEIWTKTDENSGTSSSDGLLTPSEDSSQTQVYLGDGLYYDPSEALPEEAETTTDVLKEYGMTPNRLSRKASEISSIYGPIERSDAETVKMQIEMLRGNYRQAFRHWKNSWKAAAVEPGTYVETAVSIGALAGSVAGPRSKTPVSMDEALDLADNFMKPKVPITSVKQPSGMQFIQNYADDVGNQVTKRVGFDVNPSSAHVKSQGGPHLNLQTQINGKIVRNGPLADPHIPIDPSTVRPTDF